MPGVDKENINVNVTGHHVTLHAEKGDKKYHADIPIDINLDESTTKAVFLNGIYWNSKSNSKKILDQRVKRSRYSSENYLKFLSSNSYFVPESESQTLHAAVGVLFLFQLIMSSLNSLFCRITILSTNYTGSMIF